MPGFTALLRGILIPRHPWRQVLDVLAEKLGRQIRRRSTSHNIALCGRDDELDGTMDSLFL